MYYGNHSRYFSVLKVLFQKLFVSITQSKILYNTIHQVSTRQCKKYWAVAATIFYRIGYIKISNGRQYVTTSARRFHFTVLLKFRLETQLLLNLILGEMCRVTICESLGLIINLLDLLMISYLSTYTYFLPQYNCRKLFSAQSKLFGVTVPFKVAETTYSIHLGY